MAEGGDNQIECGFCVGKLKYLEDPRSLPCGHIHCLRCLAGSFEVSRIVRCPFCREVYDVEIDSLPTSNTRDDLSLCCDTCTRKGVANQQAVVYCKTCTARFCAKHRESHDELLGAHPMITMTDYRVEARKLKPRLCSKHPELPYTMGCRSCHSIFCNACVDNSPECTGGSPHKLMTLNGLVAKLSEEMNEMKSEILKKEDEFRDLLKHMTGVLCDYDSETRDMIETLHRTRDEQIQNIQLKYKNLEQELLKLRENVKLELERFTEQNVGVKLSDLNRHRLQIEARHKHNHQVDIITRHEQTITELIKLISDEPPTLEISKAGLQVKGERREMELEIVSFPERVVHTEHELTTNDTLPKQLTLLHAVESGYCTSVCSYQGKTYVGQGNRVDIIEDNNQSSREFITVTDCVHSVAVYKDRLYTLVYGYPHTAVTVHNLAGKLITSWIHSDIKNCFCNKLGIVNDQLVIPDRLNKKLIVYSLTGKVEKHINCPLLSADDVSACAVDDLSVVVSDCESSKVFKVNISSGEVEWTSEHVTQPQGVAYHGGRVYVTNESTTTRVWILDGNTGDLLTETSDSAVIRDTSSVWDLYVTGNTLTVPRYDDRKVLFNQMD